MKTGVMRFSALGDIAASLPVLRAFERKPLIITSPVGRELLKDEFDDFILLEDKSFLSMLRVVAKIKRARLDILVDLQSNDRSRFLTSLSKKVYNSRSVDTSGSVTEIFYKIARQSGCVGEMDLSFEKKSGNYIVLNTGSSPKWLSKRPPFGKWREISEVLYERYGLDFVLTGDSSEREYIEELSGHLVGNSENIAGETDIQGLKKVLAGAFLTVSTDSASMHISAACKTPTIGIFGATSWIRSAPFGPWSTVVYDRRLYPDGKPPSSSMDRIGNYYDNIDIVEALDRIKDYI